MSAAARLLHFGKIATKRLFVFAALLTVFAAGGAAALWAQQSPAFAAFASGWKDLPRDRLDEFSRIYALIKRDYVEDVEGGNLIESAIRGMVGSLDPYSIYLNSEERQQLHRALAGEYGGIGIFVGQRDGYIEVISPIDETPATRAGIRGGDLIVGINGESTENMDIDTAIGMMRGKPGTNVSLLVATPAVAAAPRALTLAREVVTSPSVRSALIEPDYGYLRLTQFQQAKSARDMALNLASLYAANGRDLRGLILDLRNNPGGGLAFEHRHRVDVFARRTHGRRHARAHQKRRPRISLLAAPLPTRRGIDRKGEFENFATPIFRPSTKRANCRSC